MTGRGRGLAALVLLALGAGCAHKSYVVLLDDGSGRPTSVLVSTSGGTQAITETWHGCEIEPGDEPPPVFAVDPAQVRADFGAAIDAQPQPPERFTLYFVADGTELTPESKAQLPAILDSIRKRTTVDVSVVGHADRMGDDAYNYQLALSRARAIGAQIVALGIDSALVQASSHGENDPLVKTADGVPEPRNRRVEVIVR